MSENSGRMLERILPLIFSSILIFIFGLLSLLMIKSKKWIHLAGFLTFMVLQALNVAYLAALNSYDSYDGYTLDPGSRTLFELPDRLIVFHNHLIPWFVLFCVGHLAFQKAELLKGFHLHAYRIETFQTIILPIYLILFAIGFYQSSALYSVCLIFFFLVDGLYALCVYPLLFRLPPSSARRVLVGFASLNHLLNAMYIFSFVWIGAISFGKGIALSDMSHKYVLSSTNATIFGYYFLLTFLWIRKFESLLIETVPEKVVERGPERI